MSSELEASVDVFVKAMAKIRSQFHPYGYDRFGKIYVLRDEPGRKHPRKIEAVSIGLSPGEATKTLKDARLGWHFLCDMQPNSDNFDEIRAEYKSLGYRAMGTEWMFIHDLDSIPKCESLPPVRSVASQEQADAIPQLARHKLKLLEGTRDFRIWDDHRDYGGVRSVDIDSASWVHSLHVHSDVRRQGYGRALMSALLESDAVFGRSASVLLASSAGATLYPLVGYRQIGVLQMFCPLR